eukprot:5154587-Amphidinium_carterae.1
MQHYQVYASDYGRKGMRGHSCTVACSMLPRRNEAENDGMSPCNQAAGSGNARGHNFRWAVIVEFQSVSGL